jgi:hypothetical protein
MAVDECSGERILRSYQLTRREVQLVEDEAERTGKARGRIVGEAIRCLLGDEAIHDPKGAKADVLEGLIRELMKRLDVPEGSESFGARLSRFGGVRRLPWVSERVGSPHRGRKLTSSEERRRWLRSLNEKLPRR